MGNWAVNLTLDKFRSQKAQTSLLESLAIFVVLVLLFGGIFNIWLWGNKQIVQRQKSYNSGRVTAGTSSPDYQLQLPERAESLREEKVILTTQ